MPIGVLVNHLLEPPNRRSGISAYLFSLLAELIRNPDFRYTLATTWEAGRLPAALREGPLEVVTLPYKARQVENVLRQVVHVPRLLRRTGAVLEFNPNPVGQPVPFRPRVTVVHDLYFETMPALFSPRHVFWWRRLFPPSLRTARATICVSGQTRDELVRGHPRAVRKAVVVHEAPCLSVTGGPHPHGGAPYALFVANVSPNKNVAAIGAAVATLRARGRDLPILHVGHDDTGRLDGCRPRYPGDAGVVSVGPQEDVALSALYAHARFVLCPSLWEGFCLPLVEAQAHGTPVIASHIPTLHEVGGEGCVFIDPHDPVALADAMVRLWDDEGWRATMGARALANAQRFSWARAARETEAVFSAALAQARPWSAWRAPSAG